MENSNSNANVTKTAKALNIAAIVLCVILLPILCFNCILLVKGMINADEVPSVGKYIPLIVETDSMEDTIMTGDLIFIKKVDVNDLDIDDVITFYNPLGDGTSLVTHRIIKVINDEKVSVSKVIVTGNCESINCDGSVEINGDSGRVKCGGSCHIGGNVTGGVFAGGSVTCGNIEGDVLASGSVTTKG